MLKRQMSCSSESPATKKVKWDTWCRDYGTACEIGERSENQDAILARRDPFNIFAVFDGHGELGKLASERAVTITKASLSQHSPPETGEAAEKIIRTLINEIDEELVRMGKEKDADFGTTATIAIPYGKGSLSGVVIGNVGDSDALVIKSEGELLTLDNLSRLRNNPSEQLRVKAEGGRIVKSRVIPGPEYTNEQIRKKRLNLAISRALGHFILRNYGISAAPAFKDIPLSDGDTLVIASDGIWDVLKAKSVARTIANNDELSLNEICETMCDNSLMLWQSKLITADNAGIVIVRF